MQEVFARKPEFLPNKIPDSCWLLSASGHLVSLSCSQSLNWNYWLTRITEQRLILFQILKSYWNDFPLYNKELKIFECGDQIIPIPNQRNNCNVCLRLRKEIPVNSAKIQEFIQPLIPETCSTADCLINLVERMKRQRMKRQRMKRQRMKTATYCHWLA